MGKTTHIGRGGKARVQRTGSGKYEVTHVREYASEAEAEAAAELAAKGFDAALEEVRLGAATVAEACALDDVELASAYQSGLSEYAIEVLAKAGCEVARRVLASRVLFEETLAMPALSPRSSFPPPRAA